MALTPAMLSLLAAFSIRFYQSLGIEILEA
jgi:hypothetical protein